LTIINKNKTDINYSISKKDLIKEINNDLEITLPDHEDIINNIHIQYPFISKAEIAYIINVMFECIREYLILGECITIPVFSLAKLMIYKDVVRDILYLKIKTRTGRVFQWKK